MAQISINQLAEFSSATAAKRKRLIAQQITPNKLLIPWYQQAKAAIRNYFKDVNDESPIDDAISSIRSKAPTSKRQILDQKVSLEALDKLRSLKVPRLLRMLKYELIKPDSKKISYGDVDVIIAPDLVIRAKYRGKTIYGAIKIHICKTKPFDPQQAKYVSALLHNYLTKQVAQPGEIVSPELCICLDVFSDRFYCASDTCTKEIKEIKQFCLEVKKIWDSLSFLRP
jgi:hypothetical protein